MKLRQVFLDTETTGLSAQQGHRIVEIGCVEVIDGMPGKTWQTYLNPDRDSETEALMVHGLTEHFLRDKPRFADQVAEFIAFVSGAQLVIHHARFDLEFLDAELIRAGRPERMAALCPSVLDTMDLAIRKHGRQRSLDALCGLYGISTAERVHHGALIDAELLRQVYVELSAAKDYERPEPAGAESRANTADALRAVLNAVEADRLEPPELEGASPEIARDLSPTWTPLNSIQAAVARYLIDHPIRR